MAIEAEKIVKRLIASVFVRVVIGGERKVEVLGVSLLEELWGEGWLIRWKLGNCIWPVWRR